jgi:hypothetical protein
MFWYMLWGLKNTINTGKDKWQSITQQKQEIESPYRPCSCLVDRPGLLSCSGLVRAHTPEYAAFLSTKNTGDARLRKKRQPGGPGDVVGAVRIPGTLRSNKRSAPVRRHDRRKLAGRHGESFSGHHLPKGLATISFTADTIQFCQNNSPIFRILPIGS